MYNYSLVQLDYKNTRIHAALGDKQVTYESLSSIVVSQETGELDTSLANSVFGAILFINQVSMESRQQQSLPPVISPLFEQYNTIFTAPTIPPIRECDHSIPLTPIAKNVNIGSYRLPHQ